jgi:hypothetical protein
MTASANQSSARPVQLARRFRQLLERIGQDGNQLEAEQCLRAGQDYPRLGQHLLDARV